MKLSEFFSLSCELHTRIVEMTGDKRATVVVEIDYAAFKAIQGAVLKEVGVTTGMDVKLSRSYIETRGVRYVPRK